MSDTPAGLTDTQAATMLKLQDRLNRIINPQWISGAAPFLRAAFVESAEALEHHGWKWWKKQSIDLPQVQMELVDILHFYLSHTLASAGGSVDDAALLLMADLASPDVIALDGHTLRLNELDVPQLLELIGGLAVCRRASYKTLEHAMAHCKLSWNGAFTHYVSKNVLNIFRQENGYKEGTYAKIWRGEEDNVVLARLMSGLDPTRPDFAEALHAGLRHAYAQVR